MSLTTDQALVAIALNIIGYKPGASDTKKFLELPDLFQSWASIAPSQLETLAQNVENVKGRKAAGLRQFLGVKANRSIPQVMDEINNIISTNRDIISAIDHNITRITTPEERRDPSTLRPDPSTLRPDPVEEEEEFRDAPILERTERPVTLQEYLGLQTPGQFGLSDAEQEFLYKLQSKYPDLLDYFMENWEKPIDDLPPEISGLIREIHQEPRPGFLGEPTFETEFEDVGALQPQIMQARLPEEDIDQIANQWDFPIAPAVPELAPRPIGEQMRQGMSEQIADEPGIMSRPTHSRYALHPSLQPPPEPDIEMGFAPGARPKEEPAIHEDIMGLLRDPQLQPTVPELHDPHVTLDMPPVDWEPEKIAERKYADDFHKQQKAEEQAARNTQEASHIRGVDGPHAQHAEMEQYHPFDTEEPLVEPDEDPANLYHVKIYALSFKKNVPREKTYLRTLSNEEIGILDELVGTWYSNFYKEKVPHMVKGVTTRDPEVMRSLQDLLNTDNDPIKIKNIETLTPDGAVIKN
jgi:hypothetical protein